MRALQHEWTVVIRSTHDVEKTSEGWRIRRVMLDPSTTGATWWGWRS
ncbi:4-hydroxy-2-oxovalerate aldolase [Myxococcus sp. MxC21-1]|nr:4-hydroxy-2-oxovalerate aldolase [Myxococcus sp. MxC21-1]WNZ60689.1 4-hydroxy-2-oxovalerate aldolase [Myxococcus sp. MxC21-1]